MNFEEKHIFGEKSLVLKVPNREIFVAMFLI
jgi:hypothetical protein